MLRGRAHPPEIELAFRAFGEVVRSVERATAELTQVMPTARLPGRPFGEALAAFEDLLRAAERSMAGWRAPELDAEWRSASAGLAEALSRARRLREEAPDLGGYEGLIGAVEQLIAPLEGFGAAARQFRQLRRGRTARRGLANSD
jgi:hypothetical protein